MGGPDPNTEDLVRRASHGEEQARNELFRRFRARLERMIAVRLDRRIAARVDASDVVQEALLEANRRWDAYVTRRPLPFYPWLRQIGWEVLVKVHQRHLHAGKRQVTREEPNGAGDIAQELAARLAASNTSVGKRMINEELRHRVQEALAHLPPLDEEVLVMRHLEGMTVSEVAEALGVTEGAVKTRHFRALVRLQSLLSDSDGEEKP